VSNLKIKCKDKDVPVPRRNAKKAHRRNTATLYAFLTSALDEEAQLHAPATLPPDTEHMVTHLIGGCVLNFYEHFHKCTKID
jgi:hypothetical protein